MPEAPRPSPHFLVIPWLRMSTEHARILAADDDPSALRVLCRILSRAGFTQVHTTGDGTRVPALFREIRPDLVILDLHLGPVRGTDVLRQLHPLVQEGTFLPVLIMSGDATGDAHEEVLAAGASGFLRKPFTVDEVVTAVRHLLHRRHPAE